MNINDIQTYLRKKSEIQARIKLVPYDGYSEIKEANGKKYIYVRKRVLGKQKSTYAGTYSAELEDQIARNRSELKELRKQLKAIEKLLAQLGYSENDLKPEVILNLDFARMNMKAIIYDQAILEGVATTFPETETIIENGVVANMHVDDIQKILNLKHAWEFILDKNVICSDCDYYLASYIAKLVNYDFYYSGGEIRMTNVKIGGSTYIPPIPREEDVKEEIKTIVNSNESDIEKGINLCLYTMKRQIFNDGNKRTAVIFANHYLISKGAGLLVIPFDKVSEFKNYLVEYYEDESSINAKEFLKTCIMKMN